MNRKPAAGARVDANKGDEASVSPKAPEEFVCTLTKKLMVQPVYLYDEKLPNHPELGHSYEKAAMEAHLKYTGNFDPKTRIYLRKAVLANNVALKACIKQWSQSQDFWQKPQSQEDMQELRRLLSSSNEEVQQAALKVVLGLRNASADNMGRLADAGALPLAVELLKSSTDSIQARGACLVHYLASFGPNRAKLAEAGLIGTLVKLLQSNNDAVRQAAAWAVASMTADSNAAAAFTEAGAIPALVQLLNFSGQETQAAAVHATLHIAQHDAASVPAFKEAGATPALAQLLSSPAEEVQAPAAWAVGHFALDLECAAAFAEGGVAEPLVRLVSSSAHDVQAGAAWAVANVAGNAAASAAFRAAGVAQLLHGMLSSPVPSVQQAAALAAVKVPAGFEQNALGQWQYSWAEPAPLPLAKKSSCWDIVLKFSRSLIKAS